jgi:membrane-associated phospholipid phosphatase
MRMSTRHWTAAPALLVSALTWGCADAPTRPISAPGAQLAAVKFWDDVATLRWNERAVGLLEAHNTPTPLPNGQAAASRVLTYLSLAQYRAAMAAEAASRGSNGPSASAAVAGASVAVLSSFFPSDASALENTLDADLQSPGWPGDKHRDQSAGEAIGRSVAVSVLQRAAGDNYLKTPTGTPPVGAGYWVSSGAAIVASLHGVKPFFLSSPSQLRKDPPAFGSKAFADALLEIRQISDTLNDAQLKLAQLWATGMGAFTISAVNVKAASIIRAHRATELEAARILAYGNAATFDAQIACWDAKLTYWYLRPSQADPVIKRRISQPNHPSYPSGHSCVTSGIMSVVADAYPTDRTEIERIITEAGLSRMYGGLHYRFDVEAGQAIGRAAAALALAGKLE